MQVDTMALIYQRGADQISGVHQNSRKGCHLRSRPDFDFELGLDQIPRQLLRWCRILPTPLRYILDSTAALSNHLTGI